MMVCVVDFTSSQPLSLFSRADCLGPGKGPNPRGMRWKDFFSDTRGSCKWAIAILRLTHQPDPCNPDIGFKSEHTAIPPYFVCPIVKRTLKHLEMGEVDLLAEIPVPVIIACFTTQADGCHKSVEDVINSFTVQVPRWILPRHQFNRSLLRSMVGIFIQDSRSHIIHAMGSSYNSRWRPRDLWSCGEMDMLSQTNQIPTLIAICIFLESNT